MTARSAFHRKEERESSAGVGRAYQDRMICPEEDRAHYDGIV